MSDKIKVILVEDSTTFRELVKNVLEEHPQIEVVSQALNGKVAIPRIRHYEPDVLVLDQEMPEMSGLDLLQEIKGKYPNMGTIMLSAHTTQGARLTIRCLEQGAWDFITKPSFTSDGDPSEYIRRKLIPRVLEFYRIRQRKIASTATTKESEIPPGTVLPARTLPTGTWDANAVSTPQKPFPKIQRHMPPGFCKAFGIGISTGGPVALRELFSNLKKPLRGPIFIVQHMPPVFTKQLAESLNEISKVTVLEAQDGMTPLPNNAYVAPGGKHMVVEDKGGGNYRIRITDDPPEENCKPSVNVLFRSLGETYGSKLGCAIMTGMGMDGYFGIKDIREKHSYILAQSRESCLIYGMPDKPTSEGLVDEVLDTKGIAERMEYLLGVMN